MPTETDCPECDEQAQEFATTGDEATLDAPGPDPRGTRVTMWGPTLLAPIGKPTGDKRQFAAGALTNRDLPVALKWQRQDGQGHGGSSVIGTVDGITYDENGAPWGFGLLFEPDPAQLPRLAEDAREARLLWASGAVGPSVDLDDMEFHVIGDESQYAANGERPPIEVTRGRISAVTLVQIPAFAEAGGPAVLTEMEPDEYAARVQANRGAMTAAVRSSGWADLPVADADTAWDAASAARRVKAWAGDDMAKYGRAFLWAGDGAGQNVTAYKFPIADVIGGDLKIVPKAVSAAAAVLNGGRGGTVVPSADQARMRSVLSSIRKRIDPDSDNDDDRSAGDDTDKDYASLVQEAMVAAASMNETTDHAPLPATWFEDPKLGGPTPLTVSPDGRVFGHLATWGTCHTGIPNACTTAPKSRTGYAYFHTGAVDTDKGEMAVGRISMGGGHADVRSGFRAAVEHYDATSTQAAVVRAGEDAYGIWVAGAALPGTDLAALKRSPLSGDWRRIGANLELVHALAVNSPGFPIPRARAGMVAGAQQALVAAGTLEPDDSTPSAAAPTFDVDALAMQLFKRNRELESTFARATAALAKMDVADADDSKAKARKLRALRAAKKIGGGNGVIMAEKGGM
jgi:hypothetical protein